MRQPCLLRSGPSAAWSLPPNPAPTGIHIQWLEGADINFSIQFRPATPAAKRCGTRWKRNGWPGHEGRWGAEAEARPPFSPLDRRPAD